MPEEDLSILTAMILDDRCIVGVILGRQLLLTGD